MTDEALAVLSELARTPKVKFLRRIINTLVEDIWELQTEIADLKAQQVVPQVEWHKSSEELPTGDGAAWVVNDGNGIVTFVGKGSVRNCRGDYPFWAEMTIPDPPESVVAQASTTTAEAPVAEEASEEVERIVSVAKSMCSRCRKDVEVVWHPASKLWLHRPTWSESYCMMTWHAAETIGLVPGDLYFPRDVAQAEAQYAAQLSTTTAEASSNQASPVASGE